METRANTDHRPPPDQNDVDAVQEAKAELQEPHGAELENLHCFSCVAYICQVVCCNKRFIDRRVSDPFDNAHGNPGGAAASPFLLNTVSQVTNFFGVKAKEGDKFGKISGQAICNVCYNSLQKGVNVFKTKCSCESSPVHEECTVQNRTCDYCNEIIRYIPVKLENVEDPSSLQRSGNWYPKLHRRKKA